MDPEHFFSTLSSLLGISKDPGPAPRRPEPPRSLRRYTSTSPIEPLPYHPSPMDRLGQQRQAPIQNSDMVADWGPPPPRLTPEEHEQMRYVRERNGRTYLPDPESVTNQPPEGTRLIR